MKKSCPHLTKSVRSKSVLVNPPALANLPSAELQVPVPSVSQNHSFKPYEPEVWVAAAARVMIKADIGQDVEMTFFKLGRVYRMSGDSAFFTLEVLVQDSHGPRWRKIHFATVSKRSNTVLDIEWELIPFDFESTCPPPLRYE